MPKRDDTALINAIGELAHPLRGTAADWGPLLDFARDRKIVCIGEASHGTHEFYEIRAELSRRLIEEHGFDAVVAEADWPDSYCVDRYVRGLGSDRSAESALRGFRRFPQWMWRNTVVVEFVEWLRARNGKADAERHAHFFGMDLYSLHTSIESVLRYLDQVDPEAARRARYRYSCFDHHGEDPQSYGYAASFDMKHSCEEEVVRQLIELQRSAREYAGGDDGEAATAFFSAEQNARLVKNAEEYYRSMFRGRVSSWNLRDRHMVETLEMIAEHLEAQGRPGKLIVWAHNSHLGDASATQMGRQGEWNVGQLVRERWGRERCALVGFTTHAGTVSAADDWGDPVQRMTVRPSLPGSFERLFHEASEASGEASFLLLMHEHDALREALAAPRLERAIGVIYRPRTERMSHYFDAELGEQFDAVIHVDETRALQPLERTPAWDAGEVPETYPSGV